MEVVVPWANLIIHDRHLLPWVLNSTLCQRVPRSTSYSWKTLFSTWAPARSGLEFDENINNSLLFFVHGSVGLCPISEFSIFSRTKRPCQCNCTLYGSLSMSLAVLVVSLTGFSIYNNLFCTLSGRMPHGTQSLGNHEFMQRHNDLFSFPFLS